MLKDIRRLYLYAVCFAMLLMMVFSAINLSRVSIELIFPEPATVMSLWREPEIPGETEEGFLARQSAQREEMRVMTRRNRVVEAAHSVTILFIALPLYLYHWKVAQRDDRPLS